MTHAPLAISAIFFVLAIASVLYTDFALIRLVTKPTAVPAEGSELPALTILKPLAGLEPELEENLRTFCDQEYPRFQVIFCAQNAEDPALDVARRIRASMPRCEIAVVAGGGAHVVNPKIENLLAALPSATGEILVVADSDMRVERDYLRRIASAFADPAVGAATTLYGARATQALAARLGAMFVNDQFMPSVLVATALQPLRYCFGATMAVRARVLDEIGGLAAIGATIADDYALGELVTRHGYRVALASAIPLTLVSERTLRALLAREIRWARTIRAVRPLGYAGSVVAFPMTWGLLNLIFAPAALFAGALFLAAVAFRVAVHVWAHRALRVPGRCAPWLVPLREALSVLVWAGGLVGTSARWRQARVSTRADGR
jgi:ceramide glucosyltransferase